MLDKRSFRILMLQAGFETQAALAKRAGIEPQTLSDLLAGRRSTRRHQVRIARLLKVSPGEIWE